MKFSAKKDTAFIVPLLIPVGLAFLIALWFIIRNPSFNNSWVLLVPLAFFYGIYYLWTHTYYEVKEERLHYCAAFSKGSVPIKKISRIKKSTFPVAGNRPALSFNGLTVMYSSGSELYISPEDTEGLIAALRVVNRKIKVKM